MKVASAVLLLANALFILGQDIYNYTDVIYDQLYRAANLTSVSYCIEYNRIEVGETFDCALDFCKQNLHQYEIVNVFTPSDNMFEYGISGTGYIAVGHETKEIIVVFRGSLNIQDFITDVSLDLVDWKSITTDKTCKDCKVHRGFYNALKTGFKQSLYTVEDLKANYTDYSLFVTGHSLGGALANLAGIEYSLLGYDPLVISLAGPKVGTQELADFTNELFSTDSLNEQFTEGKVHALTTGFWRVIAKDDYVPVVPPGKFYAHGGLEFAIQESKPLPPPKDIIAYSGKYQYESLLDSIDWNDILPLDIIHAYQHINYFVNQGKCLLELLKYIGLDV